MSDLAIIIPAYKETFLEEAIQSISSQTCKDFTLYVGDDCSPYPLKNIVDNYTGKIKIIYHRFETNIGGKDLVAQWERCIALSKNEKWIWLFSDDDVMEPNCVASFYKAIKETSSYYDVYHFNVNIIDEHSKVKKVPPVCGFLFFLYGRVCLVNSWGLRLVCHKKCMRTVFSITE